MTIQYKSITFDLNTTNITTVLTVPSDATVIVKTVQAVHDTASNVDTDFYVTKFSGSDTQVSHETLNKSTINMIKNTLNLEAGDAIKMQASTADEVTGIISYALLDRSQQNG
jgi:hypothetical protein|tara:strand:+ start:1901 stop:2236 length:336 start_codon:yes stop_codon:yes gene_type:complete